MLTLEICAGSILSAASAEQGGAQRIELCESLHLGGITPAISMVKEVLASTKIRTHILIRSRTGNFVYATNEIDRMIASIELMREAGCQGVVIGALNRHRALDEDAIKPLMIAAKGLSLTFHRAIDVAAEPLQLLKKLVDLGFDYVLTSGQQTTAESGISMLKQMNQYVGRHISIIAAGGINSVNIEHISNETKLLQFHASARKPNMNGRMMLENHLGIIAQHSVLKNPEETDLEEVKRMAAYCMKPVHD